MHRGKRRSAARRARLISVAAVLLVLAGVTAGILVLLREDDPGRRRRIQRITLLKPPPPPRVKEKPPEPEVEKKEEIVEPEPEETPPEPQEQASDENAPSDDLLGLDADGSAGADGFGLRAKKGGRSLLDGHFGGNPLLRKYAWYIRFLQDELRKRIHERIGANGGIPRGDLKALVELAMDARGNIVRYRICGSSGDPALDAVVEEVLRTTRVDKPPPRELKSKTLKLRISTKG